MKEENKILQEVTDEIESSLQDQKGITAHQRRLAFTLSLGVVVLIENYLLKKEVLKPGRKINHLWFKKKKENVKKLISQIITCPIENLNKLNYILDIAYNIEQNRNELAYGKPVSENTLKEKINIFLELKKELEND